MTLCVSFLLPFFSGCCSHERRPTDGLPGQWRFYAVYAGYGPGGAGVPHVDIHSIRHRATTDIANLGAPTKADMKLTVHKTMAMFMHYVHTEDKPSKMYPLRV